MTFKKNNKFGAKGLDKRYAKRREMVEKLVIKYGEDNRKELEKIRISALKILTHIENV